MVAARARATEGRLIMPSPRTARSSIPTELVKLLDDKFAAHEHRSNVAINDLRDNLSEMLRAEAEKNELRHAATMALLTGHTTKIELHDLRIDRVEEKTKEIENDRKLATGDVKRSAFAVFVGAALALLGALVSRAFKG